MAGRRPVPEPAEPARLRFKPVTRATKDDFLAVFEGRGGPSYCWCMGYRATKEERAENTSPARRQYMLDRIAKRVPIGLVGYDGREPVAWVSIAPKTTHVNLGGPDPEPGERVWSLSCMYIRRDLRGQGQAHAMIEAAVAQARRRGATAVEAYPVDPDSPSYRHMGFLPAFKAAGFTEQGRIGTRRHLMRLTVTAAGRGES